MSDASSQENRTIIRRRIGDSGEIVVGYLGADQTIYKLRGGEASPVGRVDAQNQVFRRTAYDERELGSFSADGQVHSHGLLAGGPIGWVDPDGVVVQAGFIFGEEEVGRCEGPQPVAAGAALLLLLLPDDWEENRRA
jgi:hypothetical protein